MPMEVKIWDGAGATAFGRWITVQALRHGSICAALMALSLLAIGDGPAAAQQAPSPFALDILRGAVTDNSGKAQPSAPRPGVGDGGDVKAGSGQVALVAKVTEEGQQIDRGVVWRVYSGKSADGKPRLASTSREATPVLQLTAGEHLINAAFGRANVTRKITVAAGSRVVEPFLLNVGVLKVVTVLGNNAPAPAGSTTFDIFSEERDQFGQQTRVVSSARPGRLLRLNSGLYHIVSQYGDANATVRADLTVEPGKLTEVTIVHQAARVTLRLVTRSGGEAMADTEWSIVNRQGDIVKESVGALPTHVLAPGTYSVNARSQGQVYRRTFAVRSGETAQVEVMMQ